MTEQEGNPKPPFSEDFWKGEGGEKWVKNIELLERHLDELNRILIEHCAVRPGENVLDVGCGGGPTSLALAEEAGPSGRVLGVDVSPAILEVARSRGRDVANLDFRLADASSDDLGEGAFDLIASRFGVMFFGRPLAAFCHLRRHLKPGGRLVFLCWRRFEENPWMALPAAAAFSVLPPPAPPEGEPDPDTPGPFSLGEEGRLRFLLKEAGFTGIDLSPVDADIHMGSLEEAVYMATQMGPAARALGEATETERAATLEAIRGALQEYDTSEGVVLPGAGWIVSASG